MQKFKTTTFGGPEHTSQRTKNMGGKKAKKIQGAKSPFFGHFLRYLIHFGHFWAIFIRNQVFWMGLVFVAVLCNFLAILSFNRGLFSGIQFVF